MRENTHQREIIGVSLGSGRDQAEKLQTSSLVNSTFSLSRATLLLLLFCHDRPAL